jgi:hypothetical protein
MGIDDWPAGFDGVGDDTRQIDGLSPEFDFSVLPGISGIRVTV